MNLGSIRRLHREVGHANQEQLQFSWEHCESRSVCLASRRQVDGNRTVREPFGDLQQVKEQDVLCFVHCKEKTSIRILTL